MPPGPKQSQKQLTHLDNRLATCREYKNLWQEYFKFFADGFEDKKIYERDEQAFFQIMNVLAVNHYRFVELAGDYFKDGEAIVGVLAETVSLQHLKQMSEAQFSKLLIDWHTIFIAMNKAIGKLMMQVPVQQPGKGKAAVAQQQQAPPPAAG
ncbi:MAG: hypothetical protein ACR2IE_19890 [Candidatus Sumerlaeaceae bacterium]